MTHDQQASQQVNLQKLMAQPIVGGVNGLTQLPQNALALVDRLVSPNDKHENLSSLNKRLSANPLNQQYQQGQSTENTSALLSDGDMEFIWTGLTAIYQRTWTSVSGESATDENGELTHIAKVWRAELKGVSRKQVELGLSKTRQQRIKWLTLFDFSDLCRGIDNLPTADECLSILIGAYQATGTIVERFKHPLCLAIAKHPEFDSYAFKREKTAIIIKMVKEVHAKVVAAGFDDFSESDHGVVVAIPVLPTEDELNEKKRLAEQARAELHAIRLGLSAEKPAAEKPTQNAGPVVRDYSPDPDICFLCKKLDDDCSRLDFASMPIIGKTDIGVVVVECVSFTEKGV